MRLASNEMPSSENPLFLNPRSAKRSPRSCVGDGNFELGSRKTQIIEGAREHQKLDFGVGSRSPGIWVEPRSPDLHAPMLDKLRPVARTPDQLAGDPMSNRERGAFKQLALGKRTTPPPDKGTFLCEVDQGHLPDASVAGGCFEFFPVGFVERLEDDRRPFKRMRQALPELTTPRDDLGNGIF
jgi:hypothetical protein